MIIKKSIFSTSIEVTPDELLEFRYKVPVTISIGLFTWIKDKFGLDMLPKPLKK